MTDEEALAQLRAGDLNALGWIYRKYKQPTVSTLQRSFSRAGSHQCSQADAEDVFQSVCLELHKKVADDKGLTEMYGGALAGWLYQTARNIWMAQVRKTFKEERTFRAFLQQTGIDTDGVQVDDLSYWHQRFYKNKSTQLKQTPRFGAFLYALGLTEKIWEHTNALETIIESVTAAVRLLGSPCKDLLQYYHIDGLSFEKIIEIMPNYTNYDTIKKERWRCMERLRRSLNL